MYKITHLLTNYALHTTSIYRLNLDETRYIYINITNIIEYILAVFKSLV